jgi:hypothetical protein
LIGTTPNANLRVDLPAGCNSPQLVTLLVAPLQFLWRRRAGGDGRSCERDQEDRYRRRSNDRLVQRVDLNPTGRPQRASTEADALQEQQRWPRCRNSPRRVWLRKRGPTGGLRRRQSPLAALISTSLLCEGDSLSLALLDWRFQVFHKKLAVPSIAQREVI